MLKEHGTCHSSSSEPSTPPGARCRKILQIRKLQQWHALACRACAAIGVGMALAAVRAMRRIESRICVWHDADSLSCDSVAVGLLRDNVEHFLEHGVKGARFPLIHALADVARGTEGVCFEPNEFRTELLAGWDGVWRVPTRDIVVSLETQALLGAQQHGPLLGPGGISAWLCRSGCIAPSRILGELIANLVHELSVVAAKARPSEVIHCAALHLVTGHALLTPARTVSLGPSGPYSL